MEKNNLYIPFVKGLKELGLTIEDMDNWRYAGGRHPGKITPHTKYYKLRFPGYNFPEFTDTCICGHKIKENCYIINDLNEDDLIILGNCCIKRFLSEDNAGRTCEICKKPHRNTKDNRCKDCRKKFCTDCDKEKYSNFTKCKDCVFNGKCHDCGTEISKSYIQCYNCRFGK